MPRALGSSAVIEPDAYRHVLGYFPTGVTVATAIGTDETPVGMAVGSFTSVSLDPPLVAFLPDKSSSSFPKIRDAGCFCVNVLADDQESVCRSFAAKGADKFAGIGWRTAGSGAPIIDGGVAWIDCDIEDVLDAGDHYIVLGRVRDLEVSAHRSPLLFFRRGYGRFTPASLSAPAEPDLLGRLRVTDRARPEMERLAAELDLGCLAVTAVGEELVTLAGAGRSFGVDAGDHLGQRMPFVPPLGALFVAWNDEHATEEWLDRLVPNMSEHDRRLYRGMIDRVRQRGWSIAVSTSSWIAFELTLANLSSRPTRGELESVHEAARSVGPASHEPSDSVLDGQGLRVRNISAPVFDEEGDVVLMLTIIGLPRSCDPLALDKMRSRLLAATHAITDALGGATPRTERPDSS